MSFTKKETTFVDISLTFKPNPLTGDLSVIRDSRAIQNSVKNLIMIKPIEVPFNRDVGSTISSLLFEFVDDVTADMIEEEVRRTIAYNEPRVEIRELRITPMPEVNEFRMYMMYNIIGYDRAFTIEEILTPTR